MASKSAAHLLKETRINLESSSPGATVLLRIPTPGTSSWSSRTAQKRPLPTDVPAAEDEQSFKQRHLASVASIYYRRYHSAPRSFLWRVLEEDRVLAIRAVDLCRRDRTPDWKLTLRFIFPTSIRPDCIAFADHAERDLLYVFVLTSTNQLYTLKLRPEQFQKRSNSDGNDGEWCKSYVPTAFSHKHPHRLIATNPNVLLVSLHDGGFLKLDAKDAEHGTGWNESHYNEGSWGLRSLIPFQGNNTIRYGKISMEIAAITSMAAANETIGGVHYVFAVSLDHRLRIWNLQTRRVVYNGDLLNQERMASEMTKYLIDPSHSNLVKVLVDKSGKALVVTYSPAGAGQFKFWMVSTDTEGELDLLDLFPETVLQAPMPTTDMWTLADFAVSMDKGSHSRITLWILWKNNLISRPYKLEFLLHSPNSIHETWTNDWIAVADETSSKTVLPAMSLSHSRDCSERWLDEILSPGRFTGSTLETALSLYEKVVGQTKHNPVRNPCGLADRMSNVVSASTTLGYTSEGTPDFSQFHVAVDAQWRRFHRLVVELDRKRTEALTLAFDLMEETMYIVLADGFSIVRECSALEKINHNVDTAIPEAQEAEAILLTTASAFRESLPESLMHACKTMIRVDLFSDLATVDAVKLQMLYDNCNFSGVVSDDEYAQLLGNLGGSFRTITQEAYTSILEAMTSADVIDRKLERLPFTEMGFKALVGSIKESVFLHQTLCLDQIALLTFLQGELDQEEEGLYLDTGFIYRELLSILRRLELLEWLCVTKIRLPIPDMGADMIEKVSAEPKHQDDGNYITVFEAYLGNFLGHISHSGSPTATLLTDLVIQICQPESEHILKPELIQCLLLKSNRPELASDISGFVNDDPFSTYIQGRVSLAIEDSQGAALLLQKCAFGLSLSDPKLGMIRDSSGLLNETEWNLLYSGLPRYYTHVIALFDKEKDHSTVVHFARLGLQFITSTVKDDNLTNLETDLQSRLFNGALNTSLYSEAYATVCIMANMTLQYSLLRTLVVRMCEDCAASELLAMPFIGQQAAVDEILQQQCQSIVDVTVGVPYHQILYAWRIKHGDFRGAATVSLERLQRLQMSGVGDRRLGVSKKGYQDLLDTPVTKQYLTLINALSCVNSKQAWIFSESPATRDGTVSKRKVVTLGDVRKDYQKELDRITAIENNQFAFGSEDVMDIL